MKMQKNQRGMAALSMIMIIVVLLAVIGTVVATSRGGTGNTNTETSKLHASSIIDQANSLRFGAVSIVAKGQVSLDNLLMSTAAYDPTGNSNAGTVGIYNAAAGGTVQQTPPAEAVVTPSASAWTYFKGGSAATGFNVTSVSSAANQSYAFALNGIKRAVCEQINMQHSGSSTIPTATGPWPTVTNGISGAAFEVGGAAGTAPAGWNFGCVQVGSTGNYVYFNIVQP